MEKHLLKFVALAFLALVLTGVALAGDGDHIAYANIPFDFYAGGQLQHAGEYRIAINDETHMVTIGLREAGGGSLLPGSPEEASRDDRTLLTFKLVGGNMYALREVQNPDMGLSFRANAPQTAMSQSQKPKSMTIVAQAR